MTSGSITNCYSTGDVSGDFMVGGLVGASAANNVGTITNCYATGRVTGTTYVGGLLGCNYERGTISGSLWDVQTSTRSNMCGLQYGSGCDDGNGKTTAQMQMGSTFTSAGWDFFGESTNGTEDIWRLCDDGTYYPKLTLQFPLSDFVCPDGVDMNDLHILIGQWLFEEISMDLAPDGVVNLVDWAILADGWQVTYFFDDLTVFAEQWLKTGATYCIADIAPGPDGDGKVNLLDFALFAEHWLEGTGP
jgi:hypothetical protein